MTTIQVGKVGKAGSKKIEVDGNTVRLGGSKKFVPVAEYLGSLPKGEARKFRKVLHSNGLVRLSAVRRVSVTVKIVTSKKESAAA